jgi:hypothetical protein
MPRKLGLLFARGASAPKRAAAPASRRGVLDGDSDDNLMSRARDCSRRAISCSWGAASTLSVLLSIVFILLLHFSRTRPECSPSTPSPPFSDGTRSDAPAALPGGPPETLAASLSSQCGESSPFADALPLNYVLGGLPTSPPLLPDSHATCADVEGSLTRATRISNTPDRNYGDGLPDGALTLPAGCRLRFFPPWEACGELPGLVVFIGDSLSRHLGYGLRQVLTSNYAAGTLAGFIAPPNSAENNLFFPPQADWSRLCRCDEAYRICAHIAFPPTRELFASVCPQWGAAHSAFEATPPLHLLSWWGGYFDSDALDALLRSNFTGAGGRGGGAAVLGPRAPRDRAVIVLEIGPAWADMFAVGNANIAAFVDAVFAAAARAQGGAARVVCFATPSPDDAKKPAAHVSTQGVEPTRKVNEWVAGLCRERGGRVLDAFALTRGAYSRDGTHYQSRVNSMLAQALLNLLQMAWPGAP